MIIRKKTSWCFFPCPWKVFELDASVEDVGYLDDDFLDKVFKCAVSYAVRIESLLAWQLVDFDPCFNRGKKIFCVYCSRLWFIIVALTSFSNGVSTVATFVLN